MYCPKCGLQNFVETKFCRSCGVDLSSLSALTNESPKQALSEKYIELKSLGVKGMLLGFGFLFISAVIFSIPPRDGIFWLFPLAFSIFFFATGISRFVQAKGIKELSTPNEPATLPSSRTDYVKPTASIYETDELTALPQSVTERTTNLLHLDTEPETVVTPKK